MEEKSDPTVKLHVCNFSKRIKTTKEDLLNTFSKYGDVSCIFFPYKRFCFMKFTRFEDTLNALQAAKNSEIILHNKILSVNVAFIRCSEEKKNNKKKQKHDKGKYKEKEEITGTTLINKLDDDCLIEIFLYLSMEERIKMEEVCVRWRDVSKRAWHDIRKLEFRYQIGFRPPKPDFIEKVLMRCGHYLETLDLDEVCSSHMQIIISKYCRNLTKMSLLFSRRNVEHAKAVSKLKKLQSFTLEDTQSEFLMEYLVNLPKTVESINFISGLREKTLNFSSIFEKFNALNCLGIEECTLKIDLIRAVSNKQTITKLILSYCTIERGLQLLLNLSNLEHLDLREVHNVNDNFLESLPTKCQKLKYLNVSYCRQLSDKGIRGLKNLDNLEVLSINDMKDRVTDFSLGQLNGIKKLKCKNCIGVKDCGIIQLIENCPALEKLQLEGTSITENTLLCAVNITKNRENSVILTLYADIDRLKFDVKEKNHSTFLQIKKVIQRSFLDVLSF